MTNNENIKAQATELLKKVQNFKQTCKGISGGSKNPAPIDAFER